MRRARILRYAALQFVALVTLAMVLYPGGTWIDHQASHYHVTENFLSDLGATMTWSGLTNHLSCALFFIALASIGAALIAFAWAWREFAFVHARTRWAGFASATFGSVSGAAFMGIAFTPVNLALMLHNSFVLVAFGCLLLYVAFLTIAMAANGASRAQNVVNGVYVAIVLAYVALVVFGPRLGTIAGFHMQVIGQKLVVLSSMIHITYLTTQVSRGSSRISIVPPAS